MKDLLEHRPYSLQEKDYYEQVSIGKIICNVKIYDITLDGKPIIESKGEKQSNELVGFLNGAFIMGVSIAMGNRDAKHVKAYKPYWYEIKRHSSALVFMGILGKHHYHVYFEDEQIKVKGTLAQAETLIKQLNFAFQHGAITYYNKKQQS